MFSTVLDVIRRARLIRTDTFDLVNTDPSYNETILADGEVESYIINEDGTVLSYLTQRYGGAAGLRTDRWVSTPFRKLDNQGKSKLLAATLLNTDDPYTAFWKVVFTSDTAFDVTSSLEGSQGSGATDSDFTSTNAELSIGTNAWENDGQGFAQNDSFYFSVVDCYRVVNKISADLAACAILQELYSEAVPNANEYAANLCKNAMALLEKLADPDSGLSLTDSVDYDVSSTAVDYNVSALGEDESDYLTKNELDL
jgi:hypothetical protein